MAERHETSTTASVSASVETPRGTKVSQEVDLGMGVIRTPGYEEAPAPAPAAGGTVFSDRRVDAEGNVDDHPIASTFSGKLAGVKGGSVEAKPPA